MSAPVRIAARGVVANPGRYGIALSSVALSVAFMVAGWRINGAYMAASKADGSLLILLLMFGLVLMVACAYVIGNAFSAMVSARRSEAALLRAVGMRSDQLLTGIAAEGVILGLAGTFVGIVVGSAGAVVAVPLILDRSLSPLPGIPVVIGALIVGLGTTAVALAVPAIKASRVPPVQAVSAAAVAGTERISRLRVTAGTVILVPALLFTLNPIPEGPGLFLFVIGSLMGFTALSLLSPVFVPKLTKIAGRALGKGAAAGLATRTVARNQQRVGNAVMAVALGVALFTGITTTVNAIMRLAATEDPATVEALSSTFRFITAMTAVVVAVGLVGVVNALLMSNRERRQEIGLLRAVGMTTSQVHRSLLTEATTLAIVGIGLGTVLGLIGGTGLLMKFGLPPIPPVLTLVAVALGSLLLVLAASWWPIRKVSKLPPMAALSA